MNVSRRADSADAPLPDGIAALPVILHVCHNWGGGTQRWVEDFVRGKQDSHHLLIRMVQRRNALGSRLELVDPIRGEVLMSWELAEPITTTATSHPVYAQILRAIVNSFGVDLVVVSSLIGHSLDIFGTGRPTIVVLHDFYPFCPAMFAWFEKPCTSCDRVQLEQCLAENPYNVLWGICVPSRQLELREAYGRCLVEDDVTIVAPSRSLHARYAELLPVLHDKPCHVIPHGIDPRLFSPRRVPAVREADEDSRRLRVVLPGRLSPHKGLELLSEFVGELAEFVDLLLLGAGDFGRAFVHLPHVRVVFSYEQAELPKFVEAFDPDCALLLSTVPESFSYTLSEMWALGLPVLATEHGAFAERIQEGETGFLVEGKAESIVECLRRIGSDRALLRRVADKVGRLPVRTVEAMVSDYERLFPDRFAGGRADPITLGLWQCASRLESQDVVRGGMNTAHSLPPGDEQHLDAFSALDREESVKQGGALIDSLVQQLADERARVAAMRESTSWRITRPLRMIKRLWASSKRVPARSGGGRLGHIGPESPGVGLMQPEDWIHDARQPACVSAPRGDSISEQKRETLFLPDSAILVVGAGRMDSCDGLLEFARVAMSIGRRRNGYVFVWLGRRDEAWLGEHYGEIGVPIALGVLRLVEDADLVAWFRASDVYLGCRQYGQYDPGAFEAAAVGLPVVLAYDSPLLERHRLGEILHDCGERSLCDRVLSAVAMRRPDHTGASIER